MYIVAIHHVQGSGEELARSLACVLGITPYEARPRVTTPGGGPAIVTSFAAADQAHDCAIKLQAGGFTPVLIDSEQMETDRNRLLVSQVQFTPEALHVVTQAEQQISLPYGKINLLLRGAGIISTIEIESTTKKKFALGRAVATGGLMMRKKVKTVTATANQDREPFCHLYTTGQPPLVLRQADLDYSALGENRQLSRDANFTWICTELRRRCTNALWDDRLQTRPGLAQVLGPSFDPERHLDLAITLIAQSLLQSPD